MNIYVQEKAKIYHVCSDNHWVMGFWVSFIFSLYFPTFCHIMCMLSLTVRLFFFLRGKKSQEHLDENRLVIFVCKFQFPGQAGRC